MAYDRYDTRDAPRDERSRWSNNPDRNSNWGRGRDSDNPDDRGFFERAGDEVASWFGDEDAERRRREDRMREDREQGYSSRSNERSASGRGQDRDYDRDYDRGYGSDYDRDRASYSRHQDDRDQNYDRGLFNRGGSSDRDYNRNWRSDYSASSGRDRYRPMAGDYGRSDHESDQFFAASGYGRNTTRNHDRDRSQTPWERDDYRRTSRAGTSDWSDRSRHEDPHYSSWRDRHMSELDRDYDDYRKEHQSKFENDFGSWRQKRQQKRGLLGQIREHMEVVGNDGEHVGTVDKVAGDRIILTKSDPDSGGVHHSLSCSDIDSVKDDKVMLDCSAKEAKQRWRDENRSRALFEREDQGEMGPRNLNRSFEGTYR
jgi:hypothetical protein